VLFCTFHHFDSPQNVSKGYRTRANAFGNNTAPSVATSLNNLAELLKTQGKYDEAEPLYRQAIGVWRTALGEEHPLVATGLNNLAVLLWNTGRSEEANVYGRQALAIATRALGPSHPKTQQYRKDWA
jgi:tetratricopeptide (TPR) repeat protein